MLKIISKYSLLILILAILFLIISGNFFSSFPLIIICQISAIALSIWTRKSFNNGQFSYQAEPVSESIIMTGPYKYIRHPMYSAALLLVWSSILGHLSPFSITVGIIVTIVIAIRIDREEQFLIKQLSGYADYARKTKRIIPLIF